MRKIGVDVILSCCSSTFWVLLHEFIQSSNGVIIPLRSNIELLNVLWLQVLGDSLKHPFVTIDFTIVVMLQSEQEVNLSTSEVIVV